MSAGQASIPPEDGLEGNPAIYLLQKRMFLNMACCWAQLHGELLNGSFETYDAWEIHIKGDFDGRVIDGEGLIGNVRFNEKLESQAAKDQSELNCARVFLFYHFKNKFKINMRGLKDSAYKEKREKCSEGTDKWVAGAAANLIAMDAWNTMCRTVRQFDHSLKPSFITEPVLVLPVPFPKHHYPFKMSYSLDFMFSEEFEYDTTELTEGLKG